MLPRLGTSGHGTFDQLVVVHDLGTTDDHDDDRSTRVDAGGIVGGSDRRRHPRHNRARRARRDPLQVSIRKYPIRTPCRIHRPAGHAGHRWARRRTGGRPE
jgi:hypothetical protein